MFRILVLCLFSSAMAFDSCTEGECDDGEGNEMILLQRLVRQKQPANINGNSACPCVGMQNVPGNVNVSFSGTTVEYPRETASSCKAWDENRYPSCTGSNPPSWCSTPWCYVDPCNCDADAVGASPKKSTYFPESQYQGHELYYSYATCDGTDTYSSSTVAQADKDAIAAICAPAVNETLFGKSNCMCIGVTNRPGTTTVNISGTTYDYPAEYGTSCGNWDSTLPPDCNAASPPSWCESPWCYVDPCACDIVPLPKYTSYVAGATVKGHEVYYSYATCSSVDTYTDSATATADQLAIPGICGTAS